MSGDILHERTCMHCGELMERDRGDCRHCGMLQVISPKLNAWGLGFMQNKLRSLVSQGELAEPIASRLIQLLRAEQLQTLGKSRPVAASPAPVPEATVASVPPPVMRLGLAPVAATALSGDGVGGGGPSARPPTQASVGPLDAALTGPNLLLYLGAFLIAVSGLMLVAITPDELSGQLRMLLGIGGTVAFLAAAVALYPSERVRPAASTFLVLGAVLVPLDVWSIGTTVLDPDGAARNHLLFAGSSLSAALYGVLAQRGYGSHFAYLMVLALVGVAEGSVMSLDLDDPWRGVPHLGVATAVLVTARSSLLGPSAQRMELSRLVGLAEVYAAAALILFTGSLAPGPELHGPTVAAGAGFAALARARTHPTRTGIWAWVSCIAAVIVVIDLAFEIGPATPRVGVLLLTALFFWTAPGLSSTLRWARVPGTTAGWLATLAALYVGMTSGSDARSLALFGATVRLWYDAWSSELRSPPVTSRPYLAGALFASYVLWISTLQTVGVLPETFDDRSWPALAWATLPASVAAWLAAVGRGRLVRPWAGELRVAAHVAATLAVLLMLAAPERPSRFESGFTAVGPDLGALVAILALSYAVAVRDRWLSESLPLAIALGAAAAVGGIEVLTPAPTSWAVLVPGLVGSIALASLPVVPRSSKAALRIGGIAALGVGLVVDALYRSHPHGHQFAEAIMVMLAATLAAYVLPQVAGGHRWTVSAALTALAYAYVRSGTAPDLVDPQLWIAPFVLILAAPGLVTIARAKPVSAEGTELLFAAAAATSIALAVALGSAGVPTLVVAAVGVVLLAGLALRLRDQAIAGAPVAIAAVTSHAALRYFGWSDLLVQGLVYGAVALACARFLDVRTLKVDGQTMRGLYALGVALLTLPAIIRAVRPDGWLAVAYLSALAGALLTAAVRLRRDALGVIGSVVVLIAVLGSLNQSAVAETLFYTTTVGAYLVGLGLYVARSREAAKFVTRDLVGLIRWSGALLVLIPWVLRSWEGAGYGVGFFILFVLVLAGGILLRQRSMLGAAAAAAGLEAIWVMTTVGRLLPFWMLFGVVGMTLLAIGTVLVFRRDLLDEAQRHLRERWDVAE